ncbi:DUF2635 domain-containing protein [Muricoccus aerilatus]|uniref:DUF2635 domain-containing protein n=1 Tax=Muricoccus aerilatus TaxID=452982 RepID=UPI0005C192EF|nr:DUF2635 domain-containing protein [Roseomonas aerilata]
MFVKPAKGLQIPDPELRDYLPPGGRKVTPSEYWTRRLQDEDVSLAKPSTEPKAKAAAAGPQPDAPSLPTALPPPAAAQPQE